MSSNIVDQILDKERQKEVTALKSIEVVKTAPLEYDLGHLVATDNNPVDMKLYSQNVNQYLQNLARDDVQLMINEIWKLETEKVEGSIVAKLPKPVTVLPRAQRPPKPKMPTKWERFAVKKGIQSKKGREKKVFDEATGEWKHQYGLHSQKNEDAAKEWIVEMKEGADPNEDPWKKKRDEKKERVAKNEYQRMKNVATSAGKSTKLVAAKNPIVPVGSEVAAKSKDILEKAVSAANVSTASLGKFNKKNKIEKPVKNTGKKRHFEPNEQNVISEKKKNLDIIEQVLSKKPKVDVTKAIGRLINSEQNENANEKNSEGFKKKKKSVAPSKQGKVNRGPRGKPNSAMNGRSPSNGKRGGRSSSGGRGGGRGGRGGRR